MYGWGVPEVWRQCYSLSMNSGKIVADRRMDGNQGSTRCPRRLKKVEVCLFSEFISWWNNAIRLPLAGSTFWQNHSEKSPLISSLAIPGYRGWIWIVQDCCFPSVEGALDTLTSTEKLCWRRLRAWRMFFLGELENIGKFLYSSAHPPQRERWNFIRFYQIMLNLCENFGQKWAKY